MIVFVDTSALAKRYLAEVGSHWVSSWILPAYGHTTVVADLASVEMFSLLGRQYRQNLLSAMRRSHLETSFLLDFQQQYLVIPLDDIALSNARDLIGRHPLRALDAVQLGCAMRASTLLKVPMSFISADNNLLAAATAEGFAVDNPLNHP